MFKYFLHRANSNNLLESRLYDEQSFYDAFLKDIKRAKKTVIIESPYLTERRAIMFQEIFVKQRSRGVKIIVHTRHPKCHDTLLEIQSWKAIRLLVDCGVTVRSYHDMRHRKLAMIDNEILWEGSLNILSQNRSVEIMRRTKSFDLCRQMIKFTRIGGRLW